MSETPNAILVGDREACQMLNVSPRTLYALRVKGLPHVRIGSRVLFRPSDLAAWVDSRVTVGVVPSRKPRMKIA